MLHGEELIKEIKNKPNGINLRKIYSELEYLQSDIYILQNSLKEVCDLINLIGKFLIFEENQKNNSNSNIFDTFAELDFMSEFTKLSSYDNYKINLELINTFSFLMVNIKDKTTIYYLFSGNCLNKIINKDHNNIDEEYLSYYINFLKSLSLRLDETTIQLFYIENLHSFPLIENALEFYNHEDCMIRSVVRNIVLNILKIKNPSIQNYFGKLPSISYFSDVVCHLRDICYKIDEGIKNNNINNILNDFDDLLDETLFLDDLLNLNLNKINYILLNNLFYYFILPILGGSLCSKTDKISKNLSVFLLIFFFCNIKNEVFKNSLFTLLFFEKMSVDIEYFIGKIPDKMNYSYKMNLENGINKSFVQFISENYSPEFFVNISKENNIIYLKYNQKFKELDKILEKTKNLSKKLGVKKSDDKNIKDQIEKICMSFISERDIKEMCKYHKNLSLSSGLNVGKYLIEGKGDYYNVNFLSFMNQLFNQAINNENFYSSEEFKTNKIKKGIYSLLDTKDQMIILLINILVFVVQSKETNISKDLLKYAGLENIEEKMLQRSTIGFDYNNNGKIINKNDIFDKKIMNKSVKKLQPFFEQNNFNFNNSYFKCNKIRVPNINDFLLVEKLTNAFLNNIPLLPFTFQLICYNINNLCMGWSNTLYIDPNEAIINNIKAEYKMVLYSIYYLIENSMQNSEKGYNIFRNQWITYKAMNNSKLYEVIKNSAISSCFILISKNTEIEKCPDIIKYDKKFNDDEILNNYIIMFMLIHDIKELLIKASRESKITMCKDIIKEHFPLDFSPLDFKVKEEYDIGRINPKEMYRQQIEYSLIGFNNFCFQELIIYRGYMYFCNKGKKKNSIQINQKFPLNQIMLLENGDEYIECIIINREQPEKIEIVIKFKNKSLRDEAINIINSKIDYDKKSDSFKFYKYIFLLLKKENPKKYSGFDNDDFLEDN